MQKLPNPHPSQKWSGPIERLYRMAKCMLIFGLAFEFGFLRKFALEVIKGTQEQDKWLGLIKRNPFDVDRKVRWLNTHQ